MRIVSSQIVVMKDMLYDSQCQKCGKTLYFEVAEFDADGTCYVARCCKLVYWASPHNVVISVEPDEWSEDQ